MPNVLNSQTLLDGERLAIIKVTGVVDTAETNVVKVNVANLSSYQGKACTGCKINRLWSQTHGCEILVLWEATTSVMTLMIPQNNNYFQDYSSIGGLSNNAGAGKTGNISFTTLDVGAGDAYSVILEVIKTYG